MTALLEARTRARIARTVLNEVAGLEPAERDALIQIMDDVIAGLEKLVSRLLKSFEAGVSLSDAARVGRMLSRSANLINSSVELVASRNPEVREWKNAGLARLHDVKQHANAMLRLAQLPPPTLDPERMRLSQEQMERGEGFSTAEILGDLRDR